MCSRQRFHRRIGATSVEFALIAPVLFTIFMASLEFCRVHMVRHSMENAVYEAARLGLVPQTTNQEIEQAAAEMMASVSVSTADIVARQTAEDVSVQIRVNIQDAAWMTPVIFKGNTLEARITLSKEET